MKIQKKLAFFCCSLISQIFVPNLEAQPELKHQRLNLFDDLPYDHILGTSPEGMARFIRQFSLKEYQLVSVPNNGYYYIDGVDDMIKGFLRSGVVWEQHIAELIQRYTRPESIVLDIGAHIGTLTLVASRAVGKNGKVLAFEPQPKIFRELFLNMFLNRRKNIDFYWVGVGDHEGKIELAPLVNGNEGGTPLCGGSGKFVELLTIDSLHLSNVSLMKIDVEGMEDQVLDGAKETILVNRPVIIIEIMGGHSIETASPDIHKLILGTIKKLDDLGYNVSQLWRHDWIATPKK